MQKTEIFCEDSRFRGKQVLGKLPLLGKLIFLKSSLAPKIIPIMKKKRFSNVFKAWSITFHLHFKYLEQLSQRPVMCFLRWPDPVLDCINNNQKLSLTFSVLTHTYTGWTFAHITSIHEFMVLQMGKSVLKITTKYFSVFDNNAVYCSPFQFCKYKPKTSREVPHLYR